jgi:threonine dehydrogenase-like Zn-dependent dehydrogenase
MSTWPPGFECAQIQETDMKAAIFKGPGAIAVEERPKPAVREPSDAVVRVVLACVCGSDLWYYRGESDHPVGPIGHEFIGVVDEIGDDVTTVAVGDFVISPFAWSDGVCKNCAAGFHTATAASSEAAPRATAAKPSSSGCLTRMAPSSQFRARASRTRRWPRCWPSPMS